MSTTDTAKCQKCGAVVPKAASRNYSMVITSSMTAKRQPWLNKDNNITLCPACDARRTTNVKDFMSQ